MTRNKLRTLSLLSIFVFTSLACAISGGSTGSGGGWDFSVPPLAGESYFTCVTATPVPTEQYLISSLIPTGVAPDVTVTPINTYGYTTPVPTETPYYRVEYYYKDQPVQMGGMEVKLIDYGFSGVRDNGAKIYQATFSVKNYNSDPTVLPLSMLTFIRRVSTGNEIRIGRWTPIQTDELNEMEKVPMNKEEGRTYGIQYVVPSDSEEIPEIGLITDWNSSNLEAGIPVWFNTTIDSVDCPHGYASWVDDLPPPPPTPAIIGLGAGSVGGTGLCGWPLSSGITRGFGCSEFPTGISDPMGCSGVTPYFHNGLDLQGTEGTEVVSPIPGTVEVGFDTVLGNYVKVSGNNGERHDLLHLSAQYVSNGQSVEAGQPVGAVGNTGNSTGAHLHWTIRSNGALIDPQTWGGC